MFFVFKNTQWYVCLGLYFCKNNLKSSITLSLSFLLKEFLFCGDYIYDLMEPYMLNGLFSSMNSYFLFWFIL